MPIADLSAEGNKVRLPPVLFQPMAAEDVASAVVGIAERSPVNAIVEIGGPEQFRLDEVVPRDLAARKDPPEVIPDPHAPYYGIKVSERSLVPNDDARLGETRFEDWLNQTTEQAPKAAAFLFHQNSSEDKSKVTFTVRDGARQDMSAPVVTFSYRWCGRPAYPSA
jgi:uncharacterized protein YbjT (DUF2867 family)